MIVKTVDTRKIKAVAIKLVEDHGHQSAVSQLMNKCNLTKSTAVFIVGLV